MGTAIDISIAPQPLHPLFAGAYASGGTSVDVVPDAKAIAIVTKAKAGAPRPASLAALAPEWRQGLSQNRSQGAVLHFDGNPRSEKSVPAKPARPRSVTAKAASSWITTASSLPARSDHESVAAEQADQAQPVPEQVAQVTAASDEASDEQNRLQQEEQLRQLRAARDRAFHESRAADAPVEDQAAPEEASRGHYKS